MRSFLIFVKKGIFKKRYVLMLQKRSDYRSYNFWKIDEIIYELNINSTTFYKFLQNSCGYIDCRKRLNFKSLNDATSFMDKIDSLEVMKKLNSDYGEEVY